MPLSFSFLTLPKFDPDIGDVAQTDLPQRKFATWIPIFFNEFEVKELGEHGDRNLHHRLSKGLAEADSLASIERRPCIGASSAAVGFLGKRMGHVKAIR